MLGQTILILPFGLLPVFLLLAYIFWKGGSGIAQAKVGSKIRAGITEYPHEIAVLLQGTNENKIEFTDDGMAINLFMVFGYCGITDASSAIDHIKSQLVRIELGFYEEFVDCLIIDDVRFDKAGHFIRMTITLPDETIRSERYIEQAIQNIGRVFTRNTGNAHRWLLYPQGERRVAKKDGRLLVYVDRIQLVPGILWEGSVIMSERQITRNIRNRLWNKLDVKCISVDATTYCGEILWTPPLNKSV